MPETPTDVIVPSNEFISFNTASGVAVGTATTCINKGASPILIIESATKPDDDATIGVRATSLELDYAIFEIVAGSLEIWLKADEGNCPVTYSV